MITPRKGSLFEILARAPWWVSLLIAGALFAVMRRFLPDLLAAFTTLPFIGVAGFAAWTQWRTPSAARTEESLDAIRALPWAQFSERMAESFRAEGFTVVPSKRAGVDFDMERNGYLTLVACKRWKVANAGIGPLRELHEAAQKAEARECFFVTGGTLTETASTFARAKAIKLIAGADLVQRARPLARSATTTPA